MRAGAPRQPPVHGGGPSARALLSVVLRKGYGLGPWAMTGGGFLRTLFTAAWPTGEFGAMGLRGAVRLGFGRRTGGTRGP